MPARWPVSARASSGSWSRSTPARIRRVCCPSSRRSRTRRGSAITTCCSSRRTRAPPVSAALPAARCATRSCSWTSRRTTSASRSPRPCGCPWSSWVSPRTRRDCTASIWTSRWRRGWPSTSSPRRVTTGSCSSGTRPTTSSATSTTCGGSWTRPARWPSDTGCRMSSSRRSSRPAPARGRLSTAPSPRAVTPGSASWCPTAPCSTPCSARSMRAVSYPAATSPSSGCARTSRRARASHRSPTCPRSRATSRGAPCRPCSVCSNPPSRVRHPRSS